MSKEEMMDEEGKIIQSFFSCNINGKSNIIIHFTE